MKTLTIEQLQAKLTTLASNNVNTIIGLETETKVSNIKMGQNGSRKKADKMSELYGTKPTDFVKRSKFTAMISSKNYIDLIKSFASGELNELKKELQLSTEDVDMQFKIADMIEAKKTLNEGVEVKARKNGTTLNPMIGLSSKDEHPMLRVYCRSANKPTTNYFLNGYEVDLYKEWNEFLGEKREYVSSTCKELGLTKEPFPLRDFRFENIKTITMQGDTYTMV